MKIQLNPYILLALTLALSVVSQNLSAEEQGAVNLDNVRKDIKKLASDEFAGRGPLTKGEKLTIDYLAKEYEAIGLTGANDGSYFHPVPLAKVIIDQSMVLQMGDLKFKSGSDFTARTEKVDPEISLQDSDVVFVGYGINAPEYQWNDYADVDVKGKTVIMLVNDPGFATQDEKLFTGNAMTYYGRWTYKYEEAARQGAKAVFIVHQTAPAAYPWSVVESSNTGSKYTLVDRNNNADKLPVMGWIQHEVAQKIFKAAGLNFEQLEKEALSTDFKALDLGLKANLTLNIDIENAVSNNVVATLKGSSQADEYIVIGAHWDHFGTKQTPEGDEIYNGAIDNATGVAATLELARILHAQAQIKPFKRSILFINFTAEETGLLGSEAFAKDHIIATNKMVALLNIDGMNTLDAVDYVLQYGNNMSEMESYLMDAAKAQKRSVKLDPRPQNGLFFRSDHFSFAKQGVPSLLFMSLGDTDPDYIAHRYHKVSDVYFSEWSLGGVQQDIELILAIATKLANNNDWPQWTSDSDFKTKRLDDLQTSEAEALK